MTWISEDPTYLVGLCLLASAGFFVALRATQNGKYLIWALAALGAAGVALAVDWVWVTDNERIEAVVYDLRRALLASDADAVLDHLTDDVQFVQDDRAISSAAARAMIRIAVANSKFEIVRVRGLQTSSGKLTRRGKADFKVFISGSAQGPMGLGAVGTADTSWSLGFLETAPEVWKVDRITPVSLPIGALPYRPYPQPAAGSAIPAPGEPGHGRGRFKRWSRDRFPGEAAPVGD